MKKGEVNGSKIFLAGVSAVIDTGPKMKREKDDSASIDSECDLFPVCVTFPSFASYHDICIILSFIIVNLNL